ncbi:MAG: hypothetical protein ACRDHI_04285 [Actinomycetota bacterium]
MRPSIRPLIPACILATVLGVVPAEAVVLDRDTGFDARDMDPQEPDIASTTRKLSTHQGRRVLAIIVRFYDRDAGWPLRVHLDATGGRRVDHVMNAFGEECFVWPKGDRNAGKSGRASARGDRFVCRVPARWVSPTKSISWKVCTRPPEDPSPGFEIDHAPSDQEWYG